jgi:hypothetical protein
MPHSAIDERFAIPATIGARFENAVSESLHLQSFKRLNMEPIHVPRQTLMSSAFPQRGLYESTEVPQTPRRLVRAMRSIA